MQVKSNHIENSKCCLLVLLPLADLWLELFSVALKLWGKSWKRNVPNSQTWIPAKPNFTSTRRTSEEEKLLVGSSENCSLFLPLGRKKNGLSMLPSFYVHFW